MKRFVLTGVLLWSMVASSRAQVFGQVPVVETPGPLLVQTTWGALQQTLNTIEAVFHSTQWVLDLTGYGSTGVEGLGEDIALLRSLIGESEALLWDIRSLEAQTATLFGLDGAPDSTAGLRDRLLEIRRWRQARLTQAQRLQTLQHTAVRIVGRIIGILERILDIAGDKQGLQNLQSQVATLTHTEAQTGVLIAAYQQVALDDPQEQLLTDEALDRINEAIYATMPRP
jgi:hypothetical protein